MSNERGRNFIESVFAEDVRSPRGRKEIQLVLGCAFLALSLPSICMLLTIVEGVLNLRK